MPLIFVLIICCSSSFGAIATISELEGEVYVRDEEAEIDMELNEGDKVITKDNSFAEITFEDEHIIRLQKNSELIIRKKANGHETFLGFGKLLASLKNLMK